MRYGFNFIVLIVLGLTAACNSNGGSSGVGSRPGADVVQNYCKRLDDCNFIPAGDSVEDCTQEFDKYLEGLTENEQADYKMGLEGCLALKSCTAFGDC